MGLATSLIALTRAPRRIPAAVFALGLVSVASLLGGCESTDTADGDDDDATGNIRLLDTNNYSVVASLTLPSLETASGTDLEICWPGVTSDLQCHDVEDPQADIDNVAVIRFHNLSEEEVQATLGATDLEMDDVDAYFDFHTDHSSTCMNLSDTAFFGTPIEVAQDYVESDEFTYVLTVTSGTTPGVGAKTLAFLRPTASSTTTAVEAAEGCGILTATADLSSAEPVSVPAQGPWVVDWSDATLDGQGNPISFDSIDGLLVGFYQGTNLSDLESQVFDIEQLATDLWEVELSGRRSADLAAARHRGTDELFPGFDPDADGTWLMALMCSNCQNPAPIVLCVLEPTAGG